MKPAVACRSPDMGRTPIFRGPSLHRSSPVNISSTASLASLLNVSAGRTRPQPPPDAAQAFGGTDDASRAAAQQKLFSRIDSDGDGSVTKTELTSHFSSASMSTLLSAQETSQADMVDKLMGAADADGDGALTSEEFAAAAPKRGPGGAGGPPPGGPPPGGPPPGGGAGKTEESSSSASQLLSALDTDGDGVLSAEELAAAFGSTASSDADSDEEVTESKASTAQAASASQTLKDAIAALISKGDEDDDGALSEGELTSLFEQRQTERAAYAAPAWMAEGLGAYTASGASTSSGVFATA